MDKILNFSLYRKEKCFKLQKGLLVFNLHIESQSGYELDKLFAQITVMKI